MALKRVYPVFVGSSPDVMDGVDEISVDPQWSATRPLTDGQAEPHFAGMMGHAPRIGWGSLDIAGALAIIGFGAVEGALAVYDALIGNDGELASGSNHTVHRLANATILPRQLVLPVKGNGRMTYESFGWATGSTAPYSKEKLVSLGSWTAGNESLFALGPVSINGAALSSLLDVTVDFGFAPVSDNSDGELWPKAVKVLSKLVTVTIRVQDPDELDKAMTVATGNVYRGTACLNGSSGLVVYAKKRACSGGFVANGTAEHVKLTALDGTLRPGATSGVPRTSAIVVELRRETGASLSINTASAIT